MNTQIIHMKVILVADPTPPPPPPPPERGTFLTIEPTAESLTYGLYLVQLAAGHLHGEVDWGDGTVETIETNGNLSHTYLEPGVYVVSLSDDFELIGCSAPVAPPPQSKIYALLLKKAVSNAENLIAINSGGLRNSINMTCFDFAESSLTTLKGVVFYGCSSLSGELFLPKVIQIDGSGASQPFTLCSSLTKIHFGKANQTLIENLQCYKDDPRLGSSSAEVTFDL